MEISSKLSTEELLKRIETYSENLKYYGLKNEPQDRWRNMIGMAAIIVSIRGNKIRATRFTFGRGTLWKLCFYGEVVEAETGSVISGDFKINTLASCFTFLFCGICLFILGLLVNQGIKKSYWNWDAMESMVLMVALFGFVFPGLSRYFDKDSIPRNCNIFKSVCFERN